MSHPASAYCAFRHLHEWYGQPRYAACRTRCIEAGRRLRDIRAQRRSAYRGLRSGQRAAALSRARSGTGKRARTASVARPHRTCGIRYGPVSLARWFWAGRAIEPVQRLAHEVDVLQPSRRGMVKLAPEFANDEVGMLAQAFDRYQEKLYEYVRRERTFTADASHELRTPLAVIRGAIEVLMDTGNCDTGTQTRLKRMQRGADELRDLLDALLVLARSDDADASEGRTPDLDQLVAGLLSERTDALREKRVQLLREGAPSTAIAAPQESAACGNRQSVARGHSIRQRWRAARQRRRRCGQHRTRRRCRSGAGEYARYARAGSRSRHDSPCSRTCCCNSTNAWPQTATTHSCCASARAPLAATSCWPDVADKTRSR